MSKRISVTLQPEVLRWARARGGLTVDALAKKIHVPVEKISAWESTGKISPSQVDKLSRSTYTPLGHLYLSEPPAERLPITDFRTIGDYPLKHPSPDLLQTIHSMQRRQAWMRAELIDAAQAPLNFVDSVSLTRPPTEVAAQIRDAIGLSPNWAQREHSWQTALKTLRDHSENAGVLVVFNGVVGNNTHRKLAASEFRGFALVDNYAPLIFVNGADYKPAQIFTLIHELAHIICGQGGVSNFQDLQPSEHAVEQFCNRIAAEFLVPENMLRREWNRHAAGETRYQDLARQFKVSRVVIARRALDLSLINRELFFNFYNYWQTAQARQHQTRRGSFWNNQNTRIGKRFGLAVVRATQEGRLLYRQAYSLTDLNRNAFDKFAKTLAPDL